MAPRLRPGRDDIALRGEITDERREHGEACFAAIDPGALPVCELRSPQAGLNAIKPKRAAGARPGIASHIGSISRNREPLQGSSCLPLIRRSSLLRRGTAGKQHEADHAIWPASSYPMPHQ